MQQEKNKIRWYLTIPFIIVAIFLVGPLAIPLVWMSPALKKWHKWVVTIALVALSVWLFRASMDLYATLLKDMRELQKTLTP